MADVVGYSRLMGQDEEATVETLRSHREIFAKYISQHHGRIVDAPGDALLAEFGSIVDAVNGAVEIQRELAEKNAELPSHRRMDFRIGINLGDVIVKGEEIYGDGINVAARLESLAEPGGVCISGPVYNSVKGKVPLEFDDIGEQRVKNIA
ncbi:MAG: adenylate/guanylate cyclase domain-containing protein, partial [SAR324 cluster bacterium]|nr:adenylate/guanylate cyclase domain-containing protein [SAR324 cluster bacterium]